MVCSYSTITPLGLSIKQFTHIRRNTSINFNITIFFNNKYFKNLLNRIPFNRDSLINTSTGR